MSGPESESGVAPSPVRSNRGERWVGRGRGIGRGRGRNDQYNSRRYEVDKAFKCGTE